MRGLLAAVSPSRAHYRSTRLDRLHRYPLSRATNLQPAVLERSRLTSHAQRTPTLAGLLAAQVTETVRAMFSAAVRAGGTASKFRANRRDPEDGRTSLNNPSCGLRQRSSSRRAEPTTRPTTPPPPTTPIDVLACRFTQEGLAGYVAGRNPRRSYSKNGHVAEQIRRASALKVGGVAVFSYGDLFDDHRPTARARAVYETFVSGKKT